MALKYHLSPHFAVMKPLKTEKTTLMPYHDILDKVYSYITIMTYITQPLLKSMEKADGGIMGFMWWRIPLL